MSSEPDALFSVAVHDGLIEIAWDLPGERLTVILEKDEAIRLACDIHTCVRKANTRARLTLVHGGKRR